MQARAKRRTALLLPAVIGSFAAACSTVLDLDGYAVKPVDASSPRTDTTADASSSSSPGGRDGASDALDGGASCDADPTVACYPCTPTTQVQFLNACTSATCVAFDDRTRLANLLPDGALPLLPALDSSGPNDGGGQ
jgi:hypothetical protein